MAVNINKLKNICLGLILLAFTSILTANQGLDLQQHLTKEFKGAYSKNAIATGSIKTIELIAEPGQWSLFPPYQTEVWSYNQQIPGPVIRITLGQTLKVILTNKLPQATTIHWHGVRVPNAMDGVPGVNQEPVQPGASFTYQFTPKDAGTFWFHPHVNASEQVERGLHGALIVEDPNEPVYNQDLVWILDDWKLEKGAKIYPKFVTRHDLAHDGRWGNFITVNGRYQPEFNVKSGERIRVRLINVANGRVFVPNFKSLSAQVIAVDGMLTSEVQALQHFYLAPGNRIDLDITIPANLAGKKLMVQDVFSNRGSHTLAFINVAQDAAIKTPKFAPPTAKQLPLWQEAMNTPVTHEYLLNGRRGGPYGIAWTIDGQAWPETQAQQFTAGEFIHLRFANKSPRLHPMHIHGQFFKVIARDGIAANEKHWRDTVLVGPKQTVDIAMVPIDSGTWVTHCHILEHAEAGMMTSITVIESRITTIP